MRQIIALTLLLCFGLAYADDRNKTIGPDLELKKLVEYLDDNAFRVRENASGELVARLKKNPKLLDEVLQFQTASKPEGRRRINLAIESATPLRTWLSTKRLLFQALRKSEGIKEMVFILDQVRKMIGEKGIQFIEKVVTIHNQMATEPQKFRPEDKEALNEGERAVAELYRSALKSAKLQFAKDEADSSAGVFYLKRGDAYWYFLFSGCAFSLQTRNEKFEDRYLELDVASILRATYGRYPKDLVRKLDEIRPYRFTVEFSGGLRHENYELNIKSPTDKLISSTGYRGGYYLGRPIFESLAHYLRSEIPDADNTLDEKADQAEQAAGAFISGAEWKDEKQK